MLRNRIPTILLPLLILASLVTGGCGSLLSGGKGTEVNFACVLQDERLGAPFTDPKQARVWLASTRDYLLEMSRRIRLKQFTPTQEDIQRFADLADLVKRAQSCLE